MVKRWSLYNATYVNDDDPDLFGGRCAVQFPDSQLQPHSAGVILYACSARHVRLTDQWSHTISLEQR